MGHSFHNAQTAEAARFVGENLSRENVIIGTVRCESCGYPNRVAVLPWSPQVAKVRCAQQNCEHEFSSSTSKTPYERGPGAIELITSPSRRSAGANLTPFKYKTMDTPLGKAALIG